MVMEELSVASIFCAHPIAITRQWWESARARTYTNAATNINADTYRATQIQHT